MTRNIPIAITLLAALLIAALPAPAQPPAGKGSLTVRLTTAEGKSLTTPWTVFLFDPSEPGVIYTQRSAEAGVGAVTLSDLTPRLYTAKVAGESGFAYAVRDLLVKPGSNTQDWQLPPFASLTVHFQFSEAVNPQRKTLSFYLEKEHLWGRYEAPLNGDNVTFTRVTAGEYTLVARSGFFNQLTTRTVTLAAGSNTLDWPLYSLVTLTVIACDSAGNPLPASPNPWWQVRLEGNGPIDDDTLKPGAPLVFKYLLRAPYTLRFEQEALHLWDIRTVDMSGGDVTLKWIPPPQASPTFHVTDVQGSPLKTAPVIIRLVHLGYGLERAMHAEADVPGDVSFPVIPAGDYRAALEIPGTDGVLEWKLTITGGTQTIEWRLPASTSITGALIRDKKPVTPTRGIAIATKNMGVNAYTRPVTFADGRYTVEEVFPDLNKLYLLTDAGWADVNLQHPDLTRRTDIPIQLQPGGALEVSGVPAYVERTGTKTPGRLYLTLPICDSPPLRFLFRADADGKISLPSLPPGQWHWQMEPASADNLLMGTPVLHGTLDIVVGQTQTLVGVKPAGGGS